MIHCRHRIALSIVCCAIATLAFTDEYPVKTPDIRIRDPFIYPDTTTSTYYMYAQAGNRADSGFVGVEVYTSKDLKQWSQPAPVLVLPPEDHIDAVWAPEMHAYNGRFYLFVTLTRKERLSGEKPVDTPQWPTLRKRGTHIFQADAPRGPFTPLKDGSHTPEKWMALDGTLFVENNTPYMVFCHEWVQLIDGTMDYVALKKDLSDTRGKPQLLFKASHAPGAIAHPKKGKVTDGCFLYRSPKSDRLFMIWSTFIPGKDYCVVLTHSESGHIKGPWKEHRLLYTQNGGHGMLFRTFEGQLTLALHQPNTGPHERLKLFNVNDDGQTLTITD